MSENPNSYPNQKLRGLKRKYEYILSRGGKCERCGYDKNIAALEFHHINPEEKEYQIDMRAFSNTSLDKLESELSKCELLCSNCHQEHHHPDLNMKNVPEMISKMESEISENKKKKSFSNRDDWGNVCPICGTRFPKVKGKIYCSKECREKAKGYPSYEEVKEQYDLLGSQEKVAQHFNLTRKIIRGILNKNSTI